MPPRGAGLLLFAGTLAIALPAHADEAADTRALIQAQAEEIRLLKARLEALEARAAGEPRPVAQMPVAQPPVVAVAAAPPPAKPATTINWDPAVPELVSPDGGARFKLKGRLLVDVSSTNGSRYAARNITGSEARGLWVGFEGAKGPFAYQVQVDLADNDVSVKSAYLAWRGRVPVGEVEITVGNRLSERSLDGSSSSETTPFLERNAVASAITPLKGFYGMGLTGKLFGEGWHLAAQVAGDDVNNPGDARDTVTTMVRGHWNPPVGEAATVHLAAWGFHEAFSSGVTSLSRNTFWAGHFNDNLQVSLGTLAAPDTAIGYGGELGLVRGPLWSFAEYGEREIRLPAREVLVSAWSLSAGWFVTGEGAPYARRTGAFTRMRPAHPLSRGGWGSVELVGRLEGLDNSDAPFGGTGEALTLGVNWRLEEWLRLMLNASRWKTDNSAGAFVGPDDGQAVTGRMQLTF